MSEKQKILIVDDKVENLVALRHILGELDVEVVEATSGNLALAATLDHQFALAILDVQMPEMSGYELATYLREDEKTKQTPIIFLTAYSTDEQSLFMGYEAGGIDYIIKPYEPKILLGKARLFLEMDGYRRELQVYRQRLETLVAERTKALQLEIKGHEQAQMRIEHLNSVLRSIRSINQLIVREKDSTTLINEACDLLIEARGYASAWILLGGPDQRPQEIALATLDDGVDPSFRPSRLDQWPGCFAKALHSKNGIVVLSTNKACPGCPLAEHNAHGLAITALLQRGDKVMGLLGVSLSGGMQVDKEEQSLLLEVAGDIAFALHDIRIERQHDLYAEIVANSQEPMSLVDRNYRYLKVNPSYEKLLGRTAEEIEGHSVAEVLSESFFADTIKENLDRCLAGELVRLENQRSVPGLGPRTLEDLYSPCRLPDGSVYAAAVCTRDITDIRAAQAALKRSTEFLVETGRMARVGGWALRPEDNKVFWTDVTRELHEVPDDYQPTVEQVVNFFQEEDRPKLEAAGRAALEKGEPYDLELRFTTAKGRQLWAHTSCRPVMENGQVVRLMGTFQDITQRKQSEELLLARMRLMDASTTLSTEDLMRQALDEICELTSSPFGFFHLVLPDQKTISIQVWSSKTMRAFSKTLPIGTHYPLAQAGVWAECIEQRQPVIHNDYASLPNRKGLPAWHAPIVRELTLPIIRGDSVVAILGIGNKATDYTDKDLAMVSFLADVAYEISERKRFESEREQLAAAIAQSSDAVIITDAQGVIQYINPKFERISGYSAAESLGQNPRILKSGQQDDAVYQALWETISSGRTWQGRLVNKRKDGSLFTEDARISPVFDATGAICNYVAIKTDITDRLRLDEERKHLEEQMRQAQKMESIGRLAGGVAHDFNNMLSIITGFAEIASDKVEEHDPLRKDLEQIIEAAMRSRDLTRQLLAFARRQAINPRVLDLNQVLNKSQKMLGRLIGEDIDLKLITQPGLWPVKLDSSQIDQIMANLAVNARDAIKGVGAVIIETRNVTLDQDFCSSHAEFQPGDYVLLSFSDTGTGMDKETLEKAFEPFFTTKGAGKGTGLGLSTVYGIVRQAGGLINAYSEPGQGTTFKIYLPRCLDIQVEKGEEISTKRLTGDETILVVEDEEQILDLCSQVLKRAGYNVLTANQPGEAVILTEKHEGQIHLLITDVVMPSMNGKELKERIQEIQPGIKALYMSGYTANIIAHRGVLAEGVEFLQKPFATKELTLKVRQLLDMQ